LDADGVEGLGVEQDTVEVEENGTNGSAQSHSARAFSVCRVSEQT
jgi:hypothetical protein